MTVSRYYQQHVALDAPQVDSSAFRPFWRVTTRLDRLLNDGAIGYAEWHAGRHFRSLIDTCVIGVWPGQTLGKDGGSGSGSLGSKLMDIRLDAIRRVEWVRETLGDRPTSLIASCTVDNRSWAATGRQFGMAPQTAKLWTVRALKGLAMVDYRLKLGR